VTYYLKSGDESRVTEALRRRGISFAQLSSVLSDSLHTNMIMCSGNVPARAIRELALAMTESGVPIRLIKRIRSDRRDSLYLGSRTNWNTVEFSAPPLSRAQIDQITGCPEVPDAEISNAKLFKDPRPTGRPEESRYISVWFDGDRNKGAGYSADRF